MTNHISESQKIAIACLNRWPGPKSTGVLLFSHFRTDSCFAIKWHPLKIKCICTGNLCATLDTSFLFYFNRNSVLTTCGPTNVNLSVTSCVVDLLTKCVVAVDWLWMDHMDLQQQTSSTTELVCALQQELESHHLPLF